MGYRNVEKAFRADVRPPLAHVLFLAMAATCNDKHEKPRYFGGVDWLVIQSHSDKRYVQRMMRRMELDGWISPDGYRDGRRVWVLHLPE